MAHILVIDGDICLRNVLHEVLEQEGYSVVEAQNDYEGLPCNDVRPLDPEQRDICYLVAL